MFERKEVTEEGNYYGGVSSKYYKLLYKNNNSERTLGV
jgi:hypothetical protein